MRILKNEIKYCYPSSDKSKSLCLIDGGYYLEDINSTMVYVNKELVHLVKSLHNDGILEVTMPTSFFYSIE